MAEPAESRKLQGPQAATKQEILKHVGSTSPQHQWLDKGRGKAYKTGVRLSPGCELEEGEGEQSGTSATSDTGIEISPELGCT